MPSSASPESWSRRSRHRPRRPCPHKVGSGETVRRGGRATGRRLYRSDGGVNHPDDVPSRRPGPGPGPGRRPVDARCVRCPGGATATRHRRSGADRAEPRRAVSRPGRPRWRAARRCLHLRRDQPGGHPGDHRLDDLPVGLHGHHPAARILHRCAEAPADRRLRLHRHQPTELRGRPSDLAGARRRFQRPAEPLAGAGPVAEPEGQGRERAAPAGPGARRTPLRT